MLVLQSFKWAISWTIVDIVGIQPKIFTQKIQHKPKYVPRIQPQSHLKPPIHEMIKNEIIKWSNVGVVYPIADSKWLIPF